MTARRDSGSSGSPPRSMERIMRVSMGAGQMAFTRTPSRANSSAAVRVMPMTACLLAP